MKKITLVILLVLFSCSFKNKNSWYPFKKFLFNKKPSKISVLLIHSSIKDDKDKIINDKKLNNKLKNYTKFIIDMEKEPGATKRYSIKTPALCFLNKNGESLFNLYPIKTNKIKEVLKYVKKNYSDKRRPNVLKGIKLNTFIPGEERAITEEVLKKIKNRKYKDININLINNIYLETKDKKILKILKEEVFKKIKNHKVDNITFTPISFSNKTKTTEDFFNLYIALLKSNKNTNLDLFINDVSEIGYDYLSEKLLEKDTTLIKPALKLKKSYLNLMTEKNILNIIDPKKISYFYTMKYRKIGWEKRFIHFFYKEEKKDKIKELKEKNEYKKLYNFVSKNEDEYSILNYYKSIDNILMLQFKILLQTKKIKNQDINKIITLKKQILNTFKNKEGFLKYTNNDFNSYLKPQILYLETLIDLYNLENNESFINEATNYVNSILKNFCYKKQQTIICSDISFESLKNNPGFLSMPFYSMSLNSKFAYQLLSLYAIKKDEKLINTAYKILSAFKEKASNLLKKEILNDKIQDYTNALTSLYLNPIECFLIAPSKIRNKKEVIKNVRSLFTSINYPAISFKVLDSYKKLEKIKKENPKIKKHIIKNSLILCISNHCKTYKIFNKNLKYNIENFLDKNKKRTIRMVSYL
jgi:hypothetical protein